jgi:hypothetical protein
VISGGGHAPAEAGVAPGALPVLSGYTTMDASLAHEVKRFDKQNGRLV